MIHERFDVMISPGTVYSLLYSLEREGLIMGIDKPRKRMYKLTENGEKTQKTIVESNTQIQKCLENIILSS